MLQSHFDIEVYSASRRHDLLAENERQHRLALLDAGGRQGSSRQRTGLAGLRAMVAALVARLRPAPVAAPVAQNAATITALPFRPQKPIPAADPYAGLIVIARASSVPISAEPDRIHDLAS